MHCVGSKWPEVAPNQSVSKGKLFHPCLPQTGPALDLILVAGAAKQSSSPGAHERTQPTCTSKQAARKTKKDSSRLVGPQSPHSTIRPQNPEREDYVAVAPRQAFRGHECAVACYGLQWAKMLGVSSHPMFRMLVLTNHLDECQACTELFGGAKGQTVESPCLGSAVWHPRLDTGVPFFSSKLSLSTPPHLHRWGLLTGFVGLSFGRNAVRRARHLMKGFL